MMDGLQENASPPSISSSSSSSSSPYDVTVTADGKSSGEQQPVIVSSASDRTSSFSPSHPQTFPLEPETSAEFRKQTTGAPDHQAIDRFRYADGHHFRSNYLPPLHGEEFQPGYPGRSVVPVQNYYGNGDQHQNRQKKFNVEGSPNIDEDFVPEYSRTGNGYLGQVEQSYLHPRPVDPRSIYDDPRFTYGVHHPGYFDPRSGFGGHQDIGLRDRNYGIPDNNQRNIIDSHDPRSNQMRQERSRGHGVTDMGHEVTGRGHEVGNNSQISRLKYRPESDEYEQSIATIPALHNHYYHVGHGLPYHGPVYQNSGYPGFVGRPDVRDPRSLDQFDQEFGPQPCPCCHGPPSHEHNRGPPYHPVYVDYRIHPRGDGYWDPRYFDRGSIPSFGYQDFGYSAEPLRIGETGQLYQMQRNPKIQEKASQENGSRTKSSGLEEQKQPQTKTKEEQLRIEGKNKADRLKARSCESQEDVKHDLKNTGNKNGLKSPQQGMSDAVVHENKARFKDDGEEIKIVNYLQQQSSKEDCSEEEEQAKSQSPSKPSRVSYFLNLNPPAFGRSSLRLNETKKTSSPGITPRQKKSPTVTPPNESRDDGPLTSHPGFVRGAVTRRSLQPPKKKVDNGSRIIIQANPTSSGIAPRTPGAKSGGGDTPVRARTPNPVAAAGAKTDRAGTPKPTPARDAFARLRPPRLGDDASSSLRGGRNDEAAAAAAAERARRTVDIYGSFRRGPKRTLPAVNNNGSESSSVQGGGALSRSRSTILSTKTTPAQLKPGSSAGDLLRVGGGGGVGVGVGVGGGGRVGSPSSGEDAEREEKEFDECEEEEEESGLISENDFANLEEAFKSAMTLFAAERTTNGGSKNEKSANPGISTAHQSSKKTNTHIPSSRTKSNPIQGSTKNADLESIGNHRGFDRANGGLSASSVSLASEDPVSYLNATIRRNPGNKTRRPLSAVYFSEKTKQDDDTSSVLSDNTPSTLSLGDSKLMADVFLNLSSSSADSRKEGLSELQYLLRFAAAFSKKDVKRLTEVFTRMFHEPQTKVFSLFVEVLTEFIEDHDEDLEDWLPVCLDRLLTKLGSDLLGSVINKIHRALEAVRNTFRFELQLTALAKFVSDPLHTSNVKVRSATLDHLQFLLTTMSPSNLDSEDDSLVVVLDAIIGWAMQTKTSNSKKTAQKLIISAFNLSPPTFSAILNKQSKSVQDFVRKLLHSHLRSASDSIEEEEEEEVDDESQNESVNQKESTLVRFKRETCSMASNLNTLGRRSLRSTASSSLGGSTQTIGRPLPTGHEVRTTGGQRPGPTITSSSSSSSFVRDDPSRRSGRPKVVAGARGEEQRGAGVKGRPEEEFRMSKDSGISSSSSDGPSPDGSSPPLVFSPDEESKPDVDQTVGSIGRSVPRGKEGEQARMEHGKYGRPEDVKSTSDAGDMSRWKDIVLTFSALDSSEEKRKEAMKKLVRDLPRDYTEIPDNSLRTLLGVLCLASSRTDEASELADDCISLLLKTRSVRKRISLLREVASNSDNQVKVSSLQLQYNEFQNLTQQEVRQILAEVVPSLITAFEDNESRVRKASLLCLVQLHKVAGEGLWPHIKNINDNKKNLLKMYFRRTSIASKVLM